MSSILDKTFNFHIEIPVCFQFGNTSEWKHFAKRFSKTSVVTYFSILSKYRVYNYYIGLFESETPAIHAFNLLAENTLSSGFQVEIVHSNQTMVKAGMYKVNPCLRYRKPRCLVKIDRLLSVSETVEQIPRVLKDLETTRKIRYENYMKCISMHCCFDINLVNLTISYLLI